MVPRAGTCRQPPTVTYICERLASCRYSYICADDCQGVGWLAQLASWLASSQQPAVAGGREAVGCGGDGMYRMYCTHLFTMLCLRSHQISMCATGCKLHFVVRLVINDSKFDLTTAKSTARYHVVGGGWYHVGPSGTTPQHSSSVVVYVHG